MALRDVHACIVSSVVPPVTSALREMSAGLLGHPAMVIEPGLKTGVRIAIDNPREVGADRIVNAVAAYRRYGGPCIVVDFGTATTFDAGGRGRRLSGRGHRARPHHRRRGALPAGRPPLPGRTGRPAQRDRQEHRHSMQAGIVIGYVGAGRGAGGAHESRTPGRRCARRSPVIATGGLAGLIAHETAVITHTDPDLTLDGLRMIYEMNAHRPGCTMSAFQDKHIVLGVSGGIAAYKVVDLASKLTQAGAQVDVIMTEAAQRFVTPLTFAALTHRQVRTDLYGRLAGRGHRPRRAGHEAAALVVAPATAHTIARLALGLGRRPAGARWPWRPPRRC